MSVFELNLGQLDNIQFNFNSYLSTELQFCTKIPCRLTIIISLVQLFLTNLAKHQLSNLAFSKIYEQFI